MTTAPTPEQFNLATELVRVSEENTRLAAEVAKLTQERDGLAAVIADANNWLDDAGDVEPQWDRIYRILTRIPAATLAARDAEKKAEALEDEAKRLTDMASGYTHESPRLLAGREIIAQIRERAASIRRAINE
jgi:hypothetical protein